MKPPILLRVASAILVLLTTTSCSEQSGSSGRRSPKSLIAQLERGIPRPPEVNADPTFKTYDTLKTFRLDWIPQGNGSHALVFSSQVILDIRPLVERYVDARRRQWGTTEVSNLINGLAYYYYSALLESGLKPGQHPVNPPSDPTDYGDLATGRRMPGMDLVRRRVPIESYSVGVTGGGHYFRVFRDPTGSVSMAASIEQGVLTGSGDENWCRTPDLQLILHIHCVELGFAKPSTFEE